MGFLIMGVIGYIVKLSKCLSRPKASFILVNESGKLTSILQSTFPSTTSSSVALKRFSHALRLHDWARKKRAASGTADGGEEQKRDGASERYGHTATVSQMVKMVAA